jgi:outer membrane protein assembly factor BamE (lipoprotein component of BamABCDE complex)
MGLRKPKFHVILLLCLGHLLVACVNYGSIDGVDHVWREIPIEQFEVGVTTQSEVLELLGPPSQLINLDSQVVFYYLARENKGGGQIFIVWNRVRDENRYDRAIFFFDKDVILQDVAYSREQIDR